MKSWELDALMAEKVMGFTLGGAFSAYAPYSSSIAAFQEVQREMHRRGFWMRAQSPLTPSEPWFVGFTPHGASGWNGRPDFEASGPSMMWAGCVAALNALGFKIDLISRSG